MKKVVYDPSRAWDYTKSPTERLKEQQRENTRINREKMRVLKQKPCADCGLRWHPQAMSFDHIDRRTITKNKSAKDINQALYYKPEIFDRLLRAMSVVCLNCHRIRELRRDANNPLWNKAHREEYVALLDQLEKGALLKPPLAAKENN